MEGKGKVCLKPSHRSQAYIAIFVGSMCIINHGGEFYISREAGKKTPQAIKDDHCNVVVTP